MDSDDYQEIFVTVHALNKKGEFQPIKTIVTKLPSNSKIVSDLWKNFPMPVWERKEESQVQFVLKTTKAEIRRNTVQLDLFAGKRNPETINGISIE